jgi:glyoxylase-like metal-dependent hydrolase (beta-lactamase superfamily II)
MNKILAYLTILIILVGVGVGGALAGEPGKTSLAYVTYIQWDYQEYIAAILVNSIRRWGGAYADCPVYVVLADPERTGFRIKDKNVIFVPLTISDPVRSFTLAAKAFAAAKIEEMTSGKVGSLVWLDPGTIILRPPEEYDLKAGSAAAVAPVHFINTGQAETEAIDAYWGPIYKRCGLDLKKLFTVETFIDGKKVRAWLNCGMFSVRPERGLFREWAKVLEEFINDRDYQRTAITDRGHRTFLHQAVISTLIVSRLERREIHMLPRGYNYPIFCHDLDFTTLTGDTYKIPPHKRARTLNELTSVFIESLFAEHPDWVKFIPPADEPLKSWLIDEYENSLKVADRIYREENSCNSYLVVTDGGSVLVDPGGAASSESALRRLARKSPVQAILLTHGHNDHIEGIAGWTKDKDVPVIAQREIVKFINHNNRLRGFDSRRQAIQSGTPLPQELAEIAATPIPATVLFDENHSFAMGGLHFELFHAGGETPDQSVIWIPELKAVFIGDNFYSSFPNLSTLRGSQARPALEYIQALDKALSLEPEVLLPGHGDPLRGQENIRRKLTLYRDAVRYVHDAVVKGMNEGKDARTLAQEIALPPELALPQAFGRVSWAVRGIYSAYAGWFDENPSSMYKLPPSSIDSELVRLCGGADILARRALELAQSGDDVRALHMTDIVLAVDPNHKPTLEARLSALKSLLAKSGNSIEANWLRYGIRTAEARLKAS